MNCLLMDKKVTAKSIIIATGSRPRVILGFEFDEQVVLSSNEPAFAKAAGIIVVWVEVRSEEFAHIMNLVKVHLVELRKRILPLEEKEISDHLRRPLSVAV